MDDCDSERDLVNSAAPGRPGRSEVCFHRPGMKPSAGAIPDLGVHARHSLKDQPDRQHHEKQDSRHDPHVDQCTSVVDEAWRTARDDGPLAEHPVHPLADLLNA